MEESRLVEELSRFDFEFEFEFEFEFASILKKQSWTNLRPLFPRLSVLT